MLVLPAGVTTAAEAEPARTPARMPADTAAAPMILRGAAFRPLRCAAA
jgi:hypothetical protein